MKVSLWYNNNDIRLEDVPTPVPGPGQMLVRVMACGICGSDIVEWYRLPRAPLVPGHEVGAEVVQTGPGVERFRPGNRVCIAPKVPCGTCRYCTAGHYPQCSSVTERLPGGFAEYILVPSALVAHGSYLLPDHVSFEQATFIEPLACVIRAQRLAAIEPGQTVLVLGSGMSGLLHSKLAKLNKCRVVTTDINQQRRAMAERAGADYFIDAGTDVVEELLRSTGEKADAVIIATAALPAFSQAWHAVDMGGVVVVFAVPGPDTPITVPLNELWRREVRVLTSYYCGPQDLETALELISSGAITVDELITHRVRLCEVARGFQLLLQGTDAVKIIVNPQE